MKLSEAIVLLESPRYDNTKRQVAHQFVKAIVDDIKNFGFLSYDFDGDKFSLKSYDLHFNNPIGKSFTFEIVRKGSSEIGSALGVYTSRTKTIKVGVPARDFNTEESLINTMTRDSGIHSTMFHEFIHFIDDVEGNWLKRVSGGGTSNLSFTDHSNNPKEISARTSEIIGDMERYYEQLRTNSMRNRVIRGWSRSFHNWLGSAERLTILPSMKRHMTDDNYKRLISRLYQYWDTYIKGQESLDNLTTDYKLRSRH